MQTALWVWTLALVGGAVVLSAWQARRPSWLAGAWGTWLWLAALSLPPFLALQGGLVSRRALGLAELDWIERFGLGLAVGGAFWLLLFIASQQRQRRLADAAAAGAPAHRGDGRRAGAWLLTLLCAAAEQLWWGLLRLGAADLLLSLGIETTQAQALGPWLGLLFVLLIWCSNPLWRRGWSGVPTPGTRSPQMGVALTLMATTLFIVSGNLWLGWAMQAASEITDGEQ